MYGAEANTID